MSSFKIYWFCPVYQLPEVIALRLLLKRLRKYPSDDAFFEFCTVVHSCRLLSVVSLYYHKNFFPSLTTILTHREVNTKNTGFSRYFHSLHILSVTFPGSSESSDRLQSFYPLLADTSLFHAMLHIQFPCHMNDKTYEKIFCTDP